MKIYNFEDLIWALQILRNNPNYDPSKQGFLLNVSISYRYGHITEKEKQILLNDFILIK